MYISGALIQPSVVLVSCQFRRIRLCSAALVVIDCPHSRFSVSSFFSVFVSFQSFQSIFAAMHYSKKVYPSVKRWSFADWNLLSVLYPSPYDGLKYNSE